MAHLLSLWVMATTIAATPSDLGMTLNYKVPKSCPSASTFLSQVKAAYGKDAEVAASSVSVIVTKKDKYTLELLQEDERRELEDESCESVIEAAALIVGLWLNNRPEKRTAPIRPNEKERIEPQASRSLAWSMALTSAQEVSFDDSQDFRTSLGLGLGLHTENYHFRLTLSQGLPQTHPYPVVEDIAIKRMSTRLEAQAGLKIFSVLEIFSALHTELLRVEAEQLNNAQSVTQVPVYGSLGLNYSYAITDAWTILAQASGIASLFTPRFLIDNLGEVSLVPAFRFRGKIGTEFHF